MTTLRQQLKLYESGDRLAVTDLSLSSEIQSWTYKHLASQVEKTALYLSSIGVQHGTVVAMAIPNSIEFILSFLAIGSLGAVAAPLNFSYTDSEFEFYIDDSQSKYFVVSSVGNSTGEEVAKRRGLKIVQLLIDPKTQESILCGKTQNDCFTTIALNPPTRDVLDAKPDEVCLLLHTSGTTSRPKAVPLTHNNLCTTIRNIIRTYELNDKDVNLLVMPLFHVHGLLCALLSTFGSSGQVIIPKEGKFSASRFWKDAVDYKVTWYTAVPTIHQVLLLRAETDYPKDSPPPLRFIRSCSAPLAAAILGKVEKAFNVTVLEAYAMTEASHQMSSNPLKGIRKPGTVGIGQNVEIAILDDQCKILGPNQVGEVCVRGANVTKGYLNNPEANQKVFAGGWFHTGDLGQMDEDGYLTLVGRIKELINRGGEKISPLELDNFLLSHDCVEEAVAFGAPNEKYGEEVNAAVVLKPGKTTTEEQLQEFCRGSLAGFKVPCKIFIAEKLPKTATGKIQRRIVAEHFLKKK